MGTPMLSSQTHFSPPQHAISPQRVYRASASPAISSIIDPPAPPVPVQQQLPPQQHSGYSNQSYPSYGSNASPPVHHYGQSPSKQAPTLSQITNPSPPPPQPPRFSQQSPPQPQPFQQSQYPAPRQDQLSVVATHLEKPAEKISLLQQPIAMEIDSEPASVTAPVPAPAHTPVPDTTTTSTAPAAAPTKPAKAAKKDKSTPTATPSSAPSPKPARAAKDAVPPPLPQGSGLITGALFGVDDSSSAASKTAPNIILHVPLSRDSNKIISFARLAEEKYGFAALHPRIAAQKERLARVAAASAALENNEKGGSARESAEEDLSVDIDRDSDPDGDISMGGVVTAPEEPTDGKKKRRKKKIEEYDRDDPFVDDSELVWQEQAAASKDGFFVYSGPLVAEGEKVQVERCVLCISFHLMRHLLTNLGPTVLSNAVAAVVVAAVHEHVEDTHMSLSRLMSLYPPRLDFHSVDLALVEVAWLANRVPTRPSSKATISPTRARAHRRAAQVEVVVVPALLRTHRQKVAAKRLPRMQRLQRV